MPTRERTSAERLRIYGTGVGILMILAALCGSATGAQAQEQWDSVVANENVTVLLDRASLARYPDFVVRVWLQYDYHRPEPFREPASHSYPWSDAREYYLQDIDCRALRHRTYRYVAYNADGDKSQDLDFADPTWVDERTGWGSQILRALCARFRRR